MLKTKWNKSQLSRLYNNEGKTLQEIGDVYGVSRERIRQVMARFNLARDKSRQGGAGKKTPLYKSFADYLDGSPMRKTDDVRIIGRFYNKLFCSECGKPNQLQLHHINYPITNYGDIQILCRSCHKIKHNGNMAYWKQLDLYRSYTAGQPVKTLAQNYNIAYVTAYKIIHKIKNGLPAMKR